MTNKISLKAAIVNSGVSQEQLAKAFGVTRQAIWLRIKNYKRIRAKDLAKFCEIIHFDINGLDLEEKQE
jgi:transcriptional regulator with XRE-family HTH domain